ncbi:hypothetical protein ACWCPY_39890, partial [Streptomyces sp. NPDC002403]
MNTTASTDPTASTESATMNKNLDIGCADVAAEIARTDQKGSLLLAFDGAVLAGLASLADKDFALSAQIIGGAAGLALAAAAVLLLLVVGGGGGGGPPPPPPKPGRGGGGGAAQHARPRADPPPHPTDT